MKNLNYPFTLLPFGEEVGAGVGGRTTAQGYIADNIRQKFTGYERDAETGLDFAQARYYSPSMGRFTKVDPLQLSGSLNQPQVWNRYVYCVNNPLKFIDPTGLTHYTDDGYFVGDKNHEYNKDLNAYWNAKKKVWEFVGGDKSPVNVSLFQHAS